MLRIDSSAFQGFSFEVNQLENSFGTSQKRCDFMISHRYGILHPDAFLKRSLKHKQVNSLVDQDLNRNSLSVTQNTKKQMLWAYMTVTQPYSFFLAVA